MIKQRNIQPISKQNIAINGKDRPYEIHDIFHTLQGEGPYSGEPALFIRFAGCNLQCYWCDTQYNTRTVLDLAGLRQKILDIIPSTTRLLVLTGGEPFRQDIVPLLRLMGSSFRFQIETNGTLWLPNFDFDLATVVCSPKTRKVHKKIASGVTHWKYVGSEQNLHRSPDGLPMQSTQDLTKDCKLFRPYGHNKVIWLSPLDSYDREQNLRNEAAVVQSCLTHGHRLSLQTHKIINLP